MTREPILPAAPATTALIMVFTPYNFATESALHFVLHEQSV